MSTPGADAEHKGVGALVREVGASIRRGLPRTIAFGLAGAALAYFVNVWWIARRYEGTEVPDGAPVTTGGNWFAGTLFWLIAPMVLFGVIAYWRSVGNQRFWAGVRGFPTTVAGYFRGAGSRAGANFLWGLAIVIVLASVVSPAVSGVLGVGLLVAIPTVIGRVVMGSAARGLRAMANQFQPDRSHDVASGSTMAVAGTGAVAALVLRFGIDDVSSQLIVGAGAAALAVLVGYSRRPSANAGLFLIALGGGVAIALAYVFGDAVPALADDGGWVECGESWSQWFGCEGSDRVLQNAGVGAAAGGAGAGLGAGLGDAAAGGEEGDEAEEDLGEVYLELTYPLGSSPRVFTTGWRYGARAIIRVGTDEQEDVSSSVTWDGTATFSPPVGSFSSPTFAGPGPNTIQLSIDVDGTLVEKTFGVTAVSTATYARLNDTTFCAADAHGCPACPHPTTGRIIQGSPTVFIDGLPAARVGDTGIHAACCGPNTFTIKSGDPTVLIDGRPAARLGDETQECGGIGHITRGSGGSSF